jgi:hypothetical protein
MPAPSASSSVRRWDTLRNERRNPPERCLLVSESLHLCPRLSVAGIGEVKEQVTQGGRERFELVSLTQG